MDHTLCLKSELDLFTSLPMQVAIDDGGFQELHPVASITDNGPIEFFLPGSQEHYLDLSYTLLNLSFKITKSDGSLPTDVDKVGPINYLLNSLFSNVEVFLNETQISSQNNYSYRAILDALCHFPKEAQDTYLKSALFYKDSPSFYDEVDPLLSNLGYNSRSFIAKNKECSITGPLHLDISFQPKLILNGVSLKIRLQRAKNAFVLMSDKHDFVLKITKASLFVRKVQVTPSIMIAHSKILETGPAKYPLKKIGIKTFTIPQGTQSTVIPNIFLGSIPNKILIGFVSNIAYSGNFTKNPFYFQNFDLNYLSIKVDQKLYPILTPDFSTGNFYQSYIKLFTDLGRYLSPNNLNITPEDYKDGLTLFAFDLSPDFCSSKEHMSAPKNSNLSLEVRFANALRSTVNIIIYSEFDSEIQIDKQRQVTVAY